MSALKVPYYDVCRCFLTILYKRYEQPKKTIKKQRKWPQKYVKYVKTSFFGPKSGKFLLYRKFHVDEQDKSVDFYEFKKR